MKEILAQLEDEPVKNVKFKKNWISLNYDGNNIKNQIIVEKHQEFVGRWDVDINIVYVDDDLKGLDMEAIALHETIEKYISQKYDFDPYKESHDIATMKEREYIEKKKGKWKSHQIKVGKIWKNESKKSH